MPNCCKVEVLSVGGLFNVSNATTPATNYGHNPPALAGRRPGGRIFGSPFTIREDDGDRIQPPTPSEEPK